MCWPCWQAGKEDSILGAIQDKAVDAAEAAFEPAEGC
jgi:hypothetical protein